MDDTEFEARLEFSGDESPAALLVLAGELDVSAAEVLTSTLEQVNTSAPGLILDMAAVTFIDSSGLRTLIQARQMFRNELASVTIRDPQPTTTRLLELTGLTDYFVVT